MRLAWSLVACVALGCGPASPPADRDVDAPAADRESRGGDTPAERPNRPERPADACDAAETARLQASLDGAHGPDTDVVLSVKTSCGVRFLTSGPSKVGATTLHRVGSVTKTYVAGVVLSLVNEGKVRLDDPVARFVDSVPGGDGITVRQLLNHTSGLFSYTDDEEFLASMSPTRRFAPTELLAFGTRHPPTFAPGASWAYSNSNFVLLGLIAEAAGKAPIASLVRTKILDRLGLEETFFDGEEPLGAFALARGKDADGNDVTNAADISWAWAAGAIAATPSDVARWIETVASGAFYAPPLQNALLTPVATGTAGEASGLGIFILAPEITVGAGEAIGHDGGLTGFNTMAFHFPAKTMTIVTIADSDAVDSRAVLAATLEVLAAPR
jgi:D-alanyl-D-alanine carboxypeptidase